MQSNKGSSWDSVAKSFSNKSPSDSFALAAIEISGMNDRKSEPFKVFDNGCGGGSAAVLIANAFPNATVLAGDFSAGMIEAAKNCIQESGLSNVSAEIQDGVDLKLDSNQFDFTFCTLSVMFFPDYDKGFSEMYRVTKEGGTCMIVTWKDVDTIRIFEEARRRVGPYTPNHDVHGHGAFFEKPERLAEYAKRAGFKSAEVTEISHVWYFSMQDFERLASNPAVLKMGEDLDADGVKKFQEEISNCAREKAGEKGVRLDAVANVLKAIK
jgi:ubiquinone/menaquinone biosynthesis C-methylase UbiE